MNNIHSNDGNNQKTNDVNIGATQTNMIYNQIFNNEMKKHITPQIPQYITQNTSNTSHIINMNNNSTQNVNNSNNSNNNKLDSTDKYRYINPKIRRAFSTIGDLNTLHSHIILNPSVTNNHNNKQYISMAQPIIPEMPILSIDSDLIHLTNTNTNNNKLNTNIPMPMAYLQQSPSPTTTTNSINTMHTNISPTITIQSIESLTNINHKSDHNNSFQESLSNIMGAYDDAYAQNENHLHIKIDNKNKKGDFICRFSECNNKSFLTEKEFSDHRNKYHDVGLELRLIALASEAMIRTFPKIGLQCPYINCDQDLYFDCVDNVIKHLQTEHDEDLTEIMETNDAKLSNINTLFEAAKYIMLLGKIPTVFDDNLIYCCPFTKNEICPTKCFVEDSDGLMKHLQSFHGLNINDAQFILNILRFIELKPVWRYWSKEERRNKLHKRLDALLKYRGNVRKGFIKQYKNQYTKKYLKKNKKKKFNKYNGINNINNVNESVVGNENLFYKYKDCNNIGIDKIIFEQIINKILVKKYGYQTEQNMNNNNRGQKRYNNVSSGNNSPSQSKRRRLNGYY